MRRSKKAEVSALAVFAFVAVLLAYQPLADALSSSRVDFLSRLTSRWEFHGINRQDEKVARAISPHWVTIGQTIGPDGKPKPIISQISDGQPQVPTTTTTTGPASGPTATTPANTASSAASPQSGSVVASSATPNSGTSQPSNGGTQGSSASHGSPASSAPTGSAGSGSATGSQASGSAPGPSESTVAPSSGTGASSGVPASGASASGASASSKVSVSSGAPASSQIPTSSSAPGTLGRTTGGSVLSGVSASAIPSASAGLSESSSIATSSEASASPGVSAPSGSGTTSSETSASPGGTASYGDTTSPEGTVSPGGTTNSGVKTTNSGGTASSGESASSSSGVQVSSGASTPSGVSIASALPGSSGATSVPQSPESSASSGSAVSPWGAGTSSSPRTPASGQSSAATSTKASGSLASSAVPASGGSTSPVSASSQAGHSSQPSLGSSASPSPSGESQISPGASAGSDQSSVTRTGLGSSNAHTASGTGVSQSTGGSEAPPSPSITGPASTTSEPIASSPVPESASIANMSAAYFVPSQLSGTAPMITCTPPCRLVIPPWCFTTPKVFTFPPITTTLQVIGDTVSQSGSATVTGLKTVNETTVVTPSPITTTCLQYFNVNITNGSATVINPIISMVPTPFVITDSMPSGMFPVSGTTRTFTPPPQSIQSTMSGGAIMGWGSLQYGSGGSGVYTGTCNSLICGEVCQFWCPTGNLPCIFCYTIEIPGLWWPTWTIPDPNAPPCLVGCGEGGGGGSNPQSEGGEPQSSAGSEGESSTATSSSSSCMTTLTAPEVLVSCFTNNVTSSCQTISSIQVTGCDLSPTTTTEYATSTPSCATEMTAQEAFVTCFSMVPNGTTSGMEFCQTANATQITGCSVTATATTQYAFCPWIDPDDQGACGDNSTIANSTMTNSTFMTNTTTGSCATTLTVPDILVSCFSMNVTVNGTNAVCETMSSVQVTGCDVTAAATTEFAACPTIDLDDQGECGNDTMLSNMTMTNTTMSSTATNTSSSTGCATPLTVQDYVVSCFSLNSTAFCETASATNVTGCGVTAAATTTYAACPLLDPDDDQGEDGGNVTMPYNVSTGSSHTLHFDTTTAGYSMGPVSIPASWTGSTGTVVFGMYTVVYPGSTNTTVIKPRPTSGGFDADCPLPEIGAAIVEHRETTGTTGTFASIITDILVFPTGMCDWKGYWECPQNAANGHNGMYCTQTEAPPAQPIYCEQPPGPPRVTHGSYNSTTFEATLGLTCIGPKSCGLPCSVPFETPVSASHTSRTSLPFSWGLYQMIYTEHNDDYPDPYTMPPMIQPFPLLTCVGNSSARAAFVPDSTTGPATPRQTTTTPNEANEAKAFTGTLNWPRGMCDITTAISCLPQPPVSPTGYTCYNQEDSTGDFSCFKWAWHGSCSWTDSWTVTASASLGFICTGGPNCETYPPADPLIHPTSSSKFIPPPKQPAPTAANSTLQRRINKVVDYAEAICKGDMVLAGLESGNVPQSQFLSYDAITEHYQILINVGTFDDVFDSIWRDLGITDKNKLQGWAAIIKPSDGSRKIEHIYYVDVYNGVFVVEKAYGPENPLAAGTVSRLSDIMFLMWQHFCQQASQPFSNLNYVAHRMINNPTSKNIMKQAAQTLGKSWNRWDSRVELDPIKTGEQFRAVMGCPNAYGVAYLLSTHQNIFRGKTITKISLFNDDAGDQGALFKIEDASAISKVKVRDIIIDNGARPGSGSRSTLSTVPTRTNTPQRAPETLSYGKNLRAYYEAQPAWAYGGATAEDDD